MFISFRQAQQVAEIEEHTDNLGSPVVTIEPTYQARIQKAVDIINQHYPDMLKDVTDIIGHLDEETFGQFSETNPHTIFVNIPKIEDEVRIQLNDGKYNATEDEVQHEVDNQIVKTIVHEATHKQELANTGNTSENGPEAAEKAVEEHLEPAISSYSDYKEEIKKRASIIQTKENGEVGAGIDWLQHGTDNMDKIMDLIRQTVKDETYSEPAGLPLDGGRNKIDDLIHRAEALIKYMKQQLELEKQGGEEHGNYLQKGMNASEDRDDKFKEEGLI